MAKQPKNNNPPPIVDAPEQTNSDELRKPQDSAPEPEGDNFFANKRYPDAAGIFCPPIDSLDKVKNSALLILDTQPLLVPYGISKDSLDKIASTYQRFLAKKSLFVPAQVAREFANRRPFMLQELFQQLHRKKSNFQAPQSENYPMLEAFQAYKKVRELEKNFDSLKKEYLQAIDATLNHIKGWNWDDPVSLLYQKLFNEECVIEVNLDIGKIKEGHEYRFKHKIPPGYKDKGKLDEGIGDFLIWLTILQLGEKHQCDVIFVSGEEKADWWHRSEKQTLYPRFELVDEFRRKTSGKSLHIIKLTQLLELFNVEPAVIEETRRHEAISTSFNALADFQNDEFSQQALSKSAVRNWLQGKGYEIINTDANQTHADFLAHKNGRNLSIEIHSISDLGRFRSLLLRTQKRLENQTTTDCEFILVITVQSHVLARMAANRLTQSRWLPCKPVIGLLLDSRFEPLPQFLDLCS